MSLIVIRESSGETQVTGADGTSLGEVSDIFEDTRYQKRFISSLVDTFFYVENLVTRQVVNVHKNKIGNTASRWMMDHDGRLWLCDGNAILEVNRIAIATEVLSIHRRCRSSENHGFHRPGSRANFS